MAPLLWRGKGLLLVLRTRLHYWWWGSRDGSYIQLCLLRVTIVRRQPLCLPVGQAVYMYTPLRRFLGPLIFVVGEFYYEVHNDLSFDGGSQAVLDVKLA